MPGFPLAAAAAPSAAMSKRSRWQARVMASAAAAGISPASASTRASVASTVSRASSHPSSERPAPRASTPSKSSEREEDGLMRTLQVDVERVPVAAAGRDERAAPGRVDTRQHGIVRVVAEVDPGDHPVEQSPGEDRKVHSGLSYAQRPPPGLVGRGRPDPRRIRLPRLDDRVRYRFPGAVEHPAAQPHVARAVRQGRHPDREERADRLRWRAHDGSSKGVARSTMSHRYASAHSGTLFGRSNVATRRYRANAGTDPKMTSCPSSGSPGKYIWVTSRCTNARPKREKWMCAGRHAFRLLRQGYAPGRMVTNRYRPSASVRHRPAPVKFGSSGAGWRSTLCRYRPAALVCHNSTSLAGTGRPPESTTRPC